MRLATHKSVFLPVLQKFFFKATGFFFRGNSQVVAFRVVLQEHQKSHPDFHHESLFSLQKILEFPSTRTYFVYKLAFLQWTKETIVFKWIYVHKINPLGIWNGIFEFQNRNRNIFQRSRTSWIRLEDDKSKWAGSAKIFTR